MEQDAAWLGSGPDDVVSPHGRFQENDTRFAKAFMRMEQAGRIADLLLWAGQVHGTRQHARRWIRKRIDRIETQDEQGQDHLFEIELAGRLARWQGLQIELAEPDILVRYEPGGPPLALACKRPRSEASAVRAIHEARQQIRSSGYQGAIVVGMEAIFHRSEHPIQPTIYRAESPREAREYGGTLATDLARKVRANHRDAFDPRIAGVLLCGLLTYWSRRPSAYGYSWVRRTVANTAVAHAPEAMHALDSLLFDSPHSG